jgi:hypothetical protein
MSAAVYTERSEGTGRREELKNETTCLSSFLQRFLDSNDLGSLNLGDPESEYGLIHQVLGTQRSQPQPSSG